ncbi:hypothetical protein [Schauerella aestuarii]|nr:hypothetical protein [Achromobacter aestuarii]
MSTIFGIGVTRHLQALSQMIRVVQPLVMHPGFLALSRPEMRNSCAHGQF